MINRNQDDLTLSFKMLITLVFSYCRRTHFKGTVSFFKHFFAPASQWNDSVSEFTRWERVPSLFWVFREKVTSQTSWLNINRRRAPLSSLFWQSISENLEFLRDFCGLGNFKLRRLLWRTLWLLNFTYPWLRPTVECFMCSMFAGRHHNRPHHRNQIRYQINLFTNANYVKPSKIHFNSSYFIQLIKFSRRSPKSSHSMEYVGVGVFFS